MIEVCDVRAGQTWRKRGGGALLRVDALVERPDGYAINATILQDPAGEFDGTGRAQLPRFYWQFWQVGA